MHALSERIMGYGCASWPQLRHSPMVVKIPGATDGQIAHVVEGLGEQWPNRVFVVVPTTNGVS